MFKPLKIARGSVVAFSALIGSAAWLVGPEAAGGAQTPRRVEFPIPNKTVPVVITKVTLRDALVQPGRFVKQTGAPQDPVTPFLADDDWVQNLTIYLLNRTNQTIVCAFFNFSFPETTDWATRFRAASRLTLGRIPPSALFDGGEPISRPLGPQPILFGPGQLVALHLGDYIERIRADVESTRPLAALTTMEVGLAGFFFGDGTQWDGSYRALDPESHTWRRRDPGYFPGDMDGHWPGQPGWVNRSEPRGEQKQ